MRRQEVRDRAGSARAAARASSVVVRVVLAQVEGVLDQVARACPAVARRARNASRAPGGAFSRGRAGRRCRAAADRHRLLARRVGQRRGERHEVEDVVGVQVRDRRPRRRRVVDDAARSFPNTPRPQSSSRQVSRSPRPDSRCRRRPRPARPATSRARSIAHASGTLSGRAGLTRAARPAPAPSGTPRRPGARRSWRNTKRIWLRRAQARRDGPGRKVGHGSSSCERAQPVAPEEALLAGHLCAPSCCACHHTPESPSLTTPSQDGGSKAQRPRRCKAASRKTHDFASAPQIPCKRRKEPFLRRRDPASASFRARP